jgi:hypothetical protein
MMATVEMERREANARAPRPHVRGEDVDIGRLCQAIRRSRLMLRYPRECRRNAVLQYVGRNYAEEGTMEEVPVNMLALYVQIVSRSLIAKSPRVMLSTFQKENKAVVSAMQTWVNKEMADMYIDATLRRWVVDALFSVGILKVALATPSDAAHLTWNLRAGQPFCSCVDLDDFVYDMHARDFSEVAFIGHRYRVPLDTVRDSPIYTTARKQLAASTDPVYNEEGDQRANVIARTFYGQATGEEFEDMVDLWEIYLPRRRLIVTLGADNAANPEMLGWKAEALRTQKWIGSDSGPYHILGFQPVPGNILPKAPIQDLYDLHMHINQIYRKLIRQCERQKSLLVWSGAAEGDADRLKTANDGDCPRVDNPDKVQVKAFEQFSQLNFQFFQDLMARFNQLAGNLETMGGLGSQAKTKGQEELLNANSAGTVSAMQDTVTTAIQKAVKALCWYYHHDPYKVQKSVYQLPGMPEIQTVRQVTPQARQNIKWDEMDIRIDPYSIQAQTPQTRLALIQQALQQIVIPMAGILQQQGIRLDMNKLLQKWGKYTDNPDLEEVLTYAAPPQQEPQGTGDKPPMPGDSTRTYNRVNTSEQTPDGQRKMQMNMLMGQNPGGAAPGTGQGGQRK